MVSEREIPFQILPHRSSQWFGFYFQSIPIRSHCATASKEDWSGYRIPIKMTAVHFYPFKFLLIGQPWHGFVYSVCSFCVVFEKHTHLPVHTSAVIAVNCNALLYVLSSVELYFIQCFLTSTNTWGKLAVAINTGSRMQSHSQSAADLKCQGADFTCHISKAKRLHG